MKNKYDMVITDYAIVPWYSDNGELNAFRLIRGRQTTTVRMKDLDWLVKEYNITQEDLFRVAHLSDVNIGKK